MLLLLPTLHTLPPIHLRCFPPPPRRPTPGLVVLSSVSQVGNYGTVDYENKPPLKWSALYRKVSMMDDPGLGAAMVLDRWEEEERKITKWEACRVAKELRKYRRFKLALDVYLWVASQEDRYNFYSSDAAITVDLIAKVKGIASAEEYFLGLSDSMKDKRTYCALLNAYAYARLREKAEAVFQTMKNKGYGTETLVYNVMMTLYLNIEDHERVLSVITKMQKENVKMDSYSYNMWITTCAAMGNIEETERILELMKSDENVTINWTTFSTLASMNLKLGQIDKAERYLKEAELRVTGRDRMSFHYLLGLYGLVGKKEEIHRIWNWYKSSFPEILNKGYHSMLSALVKVGDIDGAESIYREWISTTARYDPKISNILVNHFVKAGIMEKAEECFQLLLGKGGSPNPTTWELLAEGYLAGKQTSKALSSLKEAAAIMKPLLKKWKPRPANITNFLMLCSEQDDKASIEALVDIMREGGCLDVAEYKVLLGAHVGTASQGITGAQEGS